MLWSDVPMQFYSFLFLGIAVLVFFYGFYSTFRRRPMKAFSAQVSIVILGVLFAAALALRILITASLNKTHYDYSFFSNWADEMHQFGFSIYSRSEFLDYPPGYLYVLYLIRAAADFFGVSEMNPAYRVLIEMPVMLFDLAGAGLIAAAVRRYQPKYGFMLYFLPLIYLFNPAVIINTCLWGQVDSILASLIALSLYFVLRKKVVSAALIYTLALLIKPQALLLLPIYAFFIINEMRISIQAKDTKPALHVLTGVAGSLLLFVLLCLPFSQGRGPFWALSLYFDTMSQYQFASMGAFNLFSLLGGNGAPVSQSLFVFTFLQWSTVLTILSVLASAIFYFLRPDGKRLLLSALYLYTSLYTLTGMMHERYLFPALILALLYFTVSGERYYLKLFTVFSVVNYTCIALSLSGYFSAYYTGISLDRTAPFFIFSFIMVLAWLSFTRSVFFELRRDRHKKDLKEALCNG